VSTVQVRSETETESASARKATGARAAHQAGRPGAVELVRVPGVL